MTNFSRRNFLKLTTGAAALAASGFPILAEDAPKKRAIKKGVGIGMVQIKGTLLDKFKLLKDLGYDGIELKRPGGDPVEEVLKARDASGLAIGNIIVNG